MEERDAGLMSRLSAILPKITEMELRVILLLKIGMRKSETAILTAHAASSVTSLVNRLYENANGDRPANSGESLNWIIKA